MRVDPELEDERLAERSVAVMNLAVKPREVSLLLVITSDGVWAFTGRTMKNVNETKSST